MSAAAEGDSWLDGPRAMRPFRVLHLIHGIHFGGAEKVVVDLVRFGEPFGVMGSVICLAGGRLHERLKQLTRNAYLIPMRCPGDVSVIPRIAHVAQGLDIDVIQTYSVRTNLLGRACGRLLRRPVVSVVQSPYARDANQTLRPKRLNAFVERYTAGWTTRFVTVNDRLADELIADGVQPERVRRIYNGVDLRSQDDQERQEAGSTESLGPTEQQVGMIAAFRPRKGAEYLLQAVPTVLAACPKTRFAFVGSGEFVRGRDYLRELRRRAERLGVHASTRFMGFCEDPRVVMRACDVVVLPSLFGEGLPLALLEAMELEKPVVATATEGNDEVVVHGVTGVLVPARDPGALSQAIVSLLRDPEKRRRMGRAGRERVCARFGLEDMLRGYAQVYAEVCEGRRV